MKHLIKHERNEISILLRKGYSLRDIARVLDRHPSTISREVRRNIVKGEYTSKKADYKAYVRWRGRKQQLKKIREHPKLEHYIHKKLELWWSPEIIAGRWNKEMIDDHDQESEERSSDVSISHVTIYKYIYSRFGYWLGYYLYTQRHRKKRRQKIWTKKRALIPHRTLIDARPESISSLLSYGHWECDLIVWPQWTKEVILTMIEKVSRYKLAYMLPNKSPLTVQKKLSSIIKAYTVKSITFDNWVEFMYHYRLWIATYFCHPYSSREKPQIERWNRDYRRYIPKGTKLAEISQEYLDEISKKLNNTPMKVLNYATPTEIYTQLSHIPSVAIGGLT